MERPGTDLVRSVAGSTHSVDLIEKVGEVGVDSFLHAGLIKDLPLLGIGVSLYRAGNHVMAHLFVKKILKFLGETDRLSQEQRYAFYQKLSAAEAEDLGETTLMLLEKCDSDIQSVLLGRAFVRLIEGTINRDRFDLYGFIIRDLNRYYVQQIRQIYENPGFMAFDAPAAQYLAIHGIVDVFSVPTVANNGVLPKSMRPTVFGQVFFDQIVKA